jgi:hypothetical protein
MLTNKERRRYCVEAAVAKARKEAELAESLRSISLQS